MSQINRVHMENLDDGSHKKRVFNGRPLSLEYNYVEKCGKKTGKTCGNAARNGCERAYVIVCARDITFNSPYQSRDNT